MRIFFAFLIATLASALIMGTGFCYDALARWQAESEWGATARTLAVDRVKRLALKVIGAPRLEAQQVLEEAMAAEPQLKDVMIVVAVGRKVELLAARKRNNTGLSILKLRQAAIAGREMTFAQPTALGESVVCYMPGPSTEGWKILGGRLLVAAELLETRPKVPDMAQTPYGLQLAGGGALLPWSVLGGVYLWRRRHQGMEEPIASSWDEDPDLGLSEPVGWEEARPVPGPMLPFLAMLPALLLVVLLCSCFIHVPFYFKGRAELRPWPTAAMRVAAPSEGILVRWEAHPGDRVKVGAPLLTMIPEGQDRPIQLRAPVAGVLVPEPRGVYRKAIAAGEPLLSIADPKRLLVEATVSQRDVAYIHPGQRLWIRVPTFPEDGFEGTVRSVGQAALPGGGFRVLGELPNPEGRLRIGLSGKIRFDGGKRTLLGGLSHSLGGWLKMELF